MRPEGFGETVKFTGQIVAVGLGLTVLGATPLINRLLDYYVCKWANVTHIEGD